MVLSGAGNRWTDHVKAFARKNNLSYMCAMSNPECSASYKGVKAVKAVKAKGLTKKEKQENITMSMEDKPVIARRESLEDIFESATPIEGFSSPAIRAVLKNKGSLNKALDSKIADQQGMLAEDVNRVIPDTKGKKAGRPKKYADPEEARKAKIANTTKRAKERKVEKKDAKLQAKIEKAKTLYNNLLNNLKSWYGANEDTSKADWYKSHPNALSTYNEYVDKIVKKVKGVEKGDFVGGSKTGGMEEPDIPVDEKIKMLMKQLRGLRSKNTYIKSKTGLNDSPLQLKNNEIIEDIERNIALLKKTIPSVLDYLKKREIGAGMKTGGMMGWVKSIIGRHPQLTRQQIEDAERYANSLMTDTRGIEFEAPSIPAAVKKQLADEFISRQTMGREDRPATGDASERFSDEIDKLKKKKKGGASISVLKDTDQFLNPTRFKKDYSPKKKEKYGVSDFVQDINVINPVYQGIKYKPEVGVKLGEVTNKNLLPAVVAVVKPVYDVGAMAASTALTGNPLLGKIVADEFWDKFGRPYDPRSRQDNEILKIMSEKAGESAAKQAKEIGKGYGMSGCGEKSCPVCDKRMNDRGLTRHIARTHTPEEFFRYYSEQQRSYIPKNIEELTFGLDAVKDKKKLDILQKYARDNFITGSLQEQLRDEQNENKRKREDEMYSDLLDDIAEKGFDEDEEDFNPDLFDGAGYIGGDSPIKYGPNRFRENAGYRGGASSLQKGLSAEMRSFVKQPLQYDLNQIIHSNDSVYSKYGMMPNSFRDNSNQFDPNAQQSIDKAIALLRNSGIITGGRAVVPTPQLQIRLPPRQNPNESRERIIARFNQARENLETDFNTQIQRALSRRTTDRNELFSRYAELPFNARRRLGRQFEDDYNELVAVLKNSRDKILNNINSEQRVLLLTIEQEERDRLEGGVRLGEDPSTYTPLHLGRRLGENPSTYTPLHLSTTIAEGGSHYKGHDVLDNYSTIIKHLVSHITDPTEPVDPRDYKHTIRLINGIRQLKGGRAIPPSQSDSESRLDIPTQVVPEPVDTPDEDNNFGMNDIDWTAIGEALMADAE